MGMSDIREVLLGLFYGYERKKPKRSEKHRLKKLKSKEQREHELLVATATRCMNRMRMYK